MIRSRSRPVDEDVASDDTSEIRRHRPGRHRRTCHPRRAWPGPRPPTRPYVHGVREGYRDPRGGVRTAPPRPRSQRYAGRRRRMPAGPFGSAGSPASSMRQGSSRWSRCRASGSPQRSQEAFASRRRYGCGWPWTEPSAAPASASRRRALEAFGATRTRAVDSYAWTCAEQSGTVSGARLRILRKAVRDPQSARAR
jgi:hypothetical protein